MAQKDKIKEAEIEANKILKDFKLGDEFWKRVAEIEQLRMNPDLDRRQRFPINNKVRGIVSCTDDDFKIGYFEPTEDSGTVIAKKDHDFLIYRIKDKKECAKYMKFSPFRGEYILDIGLTDEEKNSLFNNFGNGEFPYNIPREYEAEHHLKKFKDKAIIDKERKYPFSKYLKYTFGLEFETSCGYISEEDCFHNGLIPLRDGSISGIEYSTIVLKGNKGINLLRQELEVLKENTFFNKECSLHIHMGGLPVTPINIYVFYKLWTYMQSILQDYIPRYSYITSNYKNNCKDYCKMVPTMNSFNDLFEYFVGDKYFGSLYQPHPSDVEKIAKWHIAGRYYNCNLINMLCYNAAKTVEFRFLRPTYNFTKICTWIMIFNAIMAYSEMLINKYKIITSEDANNVVDKLCSRYNNDQIIHMVLSDIYPESIVKDIKYNLSIMSNIIMTQNKCNDYCGLRIDIEETMFRNGKKNRKQKNKKC